MIETPPLSWRDDITDREAFLESCAPDWKEKPFPDIEAALDFYATGMEPKEFLWHVKASQ